MMSRKENDTAYLNWISSKVISHKITLLHVLKSLPQDVTGHRKWTVGCQSSVYQYWTPLIIDASGNIMKTNIKYLPYRQVSFSYLWLFMTIFFWSTSLYPSIEGSCCSFIIYWFCLCPDECFIGECFQFSWLWYGLILLLTNLVWWGLNVVIFGSYT